MEKTGTTEETKKGLEHNKLSQWLPPFILIVAIIFLLFLIRTNPVIEPSIKIPYEPILEKVVGYAILVCESAATLIVTISAFQVTYNFLRGLVDLDYSKKLRSSERLRLRLGHRLSLALEFAVASDILRLAISPSSSDLMFLIIIILLRFLMNFFLEDEFATIKATGKYPDLESCDTDDGL
jgi:uncharacterized membrane protein